MSSDAVEVLEANDSVPEPFVFKKSPSLPSVVGNVNTTPPEVMMTAPVPFALISNGALEALVDIVLSVTVTPSNVEAPVTPSVVEIVAAPVIASVLPSNVRLDSPVSACAPVTVAT